MEQEKRQQTLGVIACAPVAITFDAVVNILANALGCGICGFDNVDWEWEDYDKAKQALLDSGFENPCLEDVQAQMLLMGLPLRLHMAEEEPEEQWYNLTLDNLMEGIKKYSLSPNYKGKVSDVANQDPNGVLDFYDYDAILQFAIYGEDIIG